MSQLTIEQQVKIAIAIGRYVRAADGFVAACKEHTQAQKELSELMGADSRMVAKVDYRHYLAETDADGELFDVTEIEVL